MMHMYIGCTSQVKPDCARGGMEAFRPIVHHAHMQARATQPKHHLREWRLFHDLSLEAAAERVARLSEERASLEPESRTITMTHATLSRIERGLVPYNQNLLELLAEIYKTDPASLIMRDPSAPEAIWTIWDQLTGPQRTQIVEIAKTFRRTGTDN